MSHLTTAATLVSHANGGGNGPGFFNSDNIVALLLLVGSIVIVIVGIGMAGKSNKGNLKAQANSFGSVVLAVIVMAMGATMAFVAFGEEILGFVGIG